MPELGQTEPAHIRFAKIHLSNFDKEHAFKLIIQKEFQQALPYALGCPQTPLGA